MTIRTDMQIQSLTFTASAARREVLDVSIALVHVPRGEGRIDEGSPVRYLVLA